MSNGTKDEKLPLLRQSSSQPVFEERSELKTRSKICYGIGGIPFTLTVNVIGIYISLFLLEIAMIRPAFASAIVFFGKAWEAVVNPVIGMTIDRVETRFGKLKPWLVFATPCIILTYFFLWFVPDFSEEGKLVYYLILYCAFQSFLSSYHLPYVALTMLLSPEQKDRDSATAYRMLCEVFGTVIGGVLMAQLLALQTGDDSFTDPCAYENATGRPTIAPGERHPAAVAFMTSAGIVGGVIAICCIVVQIGTTEKKDFVVEDNEIKEPIFKSIKRVFTHWPYIISVFFFLCTVLALITILGNMTLFYIYALQFSEFEYAIIVLLVTALVFVPVWQFVLLKLGKKKTIGIALILLIPTSASLLVIGSAPEVVYPVTAALGSLLSALFLCPWSMAPDVMDDFTLTTGLKRDALMVSFYVFANKLSIGITLGISTLLLGVYGYETGACSQPESVGWVLRILVSVVPMTFTILAMLFLWLYPITELRRSETRAKLAERRRSSLSALYRNRNKASSSRLSSSEPPLQEEADSSPPDVKFSIAGRRDSDGNNENSSS
ncbi:sodium-dependent lysophosphatidylcholine symporter 1-like [Ptychodera flava]|uniref:sodium-dependent lysophosphatidylcholine symporter 1-like n=1 Tax=Ptychodera flava TaxID=63121 RepID=UPI00396A4875